MHGEPQPHKPNLTFTAPSPPVNAQGQLVASCLQYGQLRWANNAVKEFGLQAEYPDVERMHKARQLAKMAEKGLWGVRSCPLPVLQQRCRCTPRLAGIGGGGARAQAGPQAER